MQERSRQRIGGPGWDRLTELETFAYGWRLQGRTMTVGARVLQVTYTVFMDAAYRAERKLQKQAA
jgi:hypothetical protein